MRNKRNTLSGPTDSENTKEKKYIKDSCRILDFAVPADQSVKIKKIMEKRDKYKEFAR